MAISRKFILAVMFACGISWTASCAISTAKDPADLSLQAHNHQHPGSELEHDDAAHQHSMVEVSPEQPIPSVSLVAHPDARQGWNLEVQASNFSFAPGKVNQAGALTEGHAHLYVDGVKMTRLYGSWYYLEELSAGSHTIAVSLNTNQHETLAHNGQPIQATVVVEAP